MIAAVVLVGCTTRSPAEAPIATSSPPTPVLPTPVLPTSVSPTSTVTPPTPATPSAVPPPSPTPVVAGFDAAAALAAAIELTEQVGVRPAGTDADVAARAWTTRALRRAGWATAEDPVALPQGGQTANVVAWLGEQRPSGAHVVIGAHLDTVGDSPGANDNASGIGVLIALAHELADEQLPTPIVLVGFGAEEYQPSEPRKHHIGSAAYADAHGASTVAMVSVDMIANGHVTCICWYDVGPDDVAVRLDAIAQRLGSGYEVRVESDISDHGPFALRGVPAAFLWTGDDDRYHTPADTIEHLDVADIARAGELVLTFVREIPAT